MRTTLSIDDDVLEAARSKAAREKRSVGDVISELARNGLTREPAKRSPKVTMENGWPVIPSRGGVVTSELVYKLLDEDW